MSTQPNSTLALLIVAGVLATSCSKKTDTAAQEASSIASTTSISASAPSTVAAEDPEVVNKREAMEFALLEDDIKNDPKGQWATGAKASSTFASNPDDTTESYHPMRATGVPDTQHYSDAQTAWATKETDAGIEWLELTYAKPVSATQVKIRQNYNPGAIIKVELFDESGTSHTVWKGPDAAQSKSDITWLNIPFEKTPYTTQRLKITLATNTVSGWNEIDAVQLIGE